MRAPLALVVVLLAAGCGAAPRAAGGTASAGGSPTLLRVHAEDGARYATTSHSVLRSYGDDVTVMDVQGTLEVRSHDGAGASLVHRIGDVRLSNGDGSPSTSSSRFDVRGVTFALTVDERGTMLGEPEATGTTDLNDHFARSMRSPVMTVVAALPEAAVSPDDTWLTSTSVALPMEARNLALHCDLESRLVEVDRSEAEPVAVVAVRSTCFLPPGSGTAVEIRLATTGEQRIALADGLPRRVTTHRETTIGVAGAPAAPGTGLRFVEDVVSTTTPIAP